MISIIRYTLHSSFHRWWQGFTALTRLPVRHFIVASVLMATSGFHAQAQKTTLLFQTHSDTDAFVHQRLQQSARRTYNSSRDAEEATAKLISGLKRAGYLTSSVDSFTMAKDTLIAWFYAGPRFLASTLEFGEEDLLLAKSAGFDTRKRKTTGAINQGQELKRITANLNRQGFPFASIDIQEISYKGDTLLTRAGIKPGQFYKWDSLEIKGDLSIQNKVLQKYLRIREGEPYNNVLIAEIERNLRSLGYLRLSAPPGIVLTEAGKARVVVQLEKQKASTFNGVIGFGPDRNNPEKLIFSGDVQLKLLNSLSYGEEMELKWNGISGDQLLMLSYRHPFLPLLPFGGVINFDLFKQGELYYNLNQRFGLLIRPGPGGWLTTYVQQKSSRVLDRSVYTSYTTLPPWTDFTTSLFGIEYRYHNLDYPQNPSKGLALGGDLAAGRKTILKAADIPEEKFEGLDLTQRQVRGDLSAEAFLPVTQRWVIRSWITGHWLNSGINHENELVRIGGMNSLRGFEERSIAASALLLGSFELRYRFEQQSHFRLFFDGGWYEKALRSSYTRDIPYGFGLGISIPSPAGVLQVDYAWGIQQGNPFEFRSGRLHFGLTSVF
jgi:outer membrane protein assembly factor BamA